MSVVRNLFDLMFLLISLFGLSGAIWLGTTAFGAEHPQPVAGPSGEVAWYDCQFGPLPERDRVRMLIMTRAGEVERVVVEPYGIVGIDHSQLRVTRDGAITGTLVIGHEPRRINRTLAPRLSTRMPLALEIRAADGQLSGTFDGQWPHEKRIDEPVDVSGKLTGTLRTEQSLRTQQAIGGRLWNSWLGPHQNFSTDPDDAEIVRDLSQAKLIWASQWIGPTESGSQRYGACVGTPPCAGGASPLYANGRVYQFRYEASGDALQQKHLDKILSGEKGKKTREQMQAVGWTMDDLRARWAIHADEQLVCIDAATGRTLWRVTWPGEGINLYSHKCSLTNHTGVIAGGNVYVFGAMGVVRCVDVESGEVRWSAEVPGYRDYMQKFLAKCLETKNVWAPTRSFCHGLNVAGDTLLAPDGIGECGIVGLDMQTGEVRWRIDDRILGKCATPMSWEHGGSHYVVAGAGNGKITAIDAADGEIAWQYDEAGDNECQMLLVGDLLIGVKTTREERENAPFPEDDGSHSAEGDNVGQVACWRLSPQGLEELWVSPSEWGAPKHCPTGTVCYRDDGKPVICFRGGFSYHLVDPHTGKKLSSHHLTAPVRWDEGHMLSVSNTFLLHPDTQHGNIKMFTLPPRPDADVSGMWQPPHPHATTYQSAMSHAWVDGRLFIRGADALYCYDLRK